MTKSVQLDIGFIKAIIGGLAIEAASLFIFAIAFLVVANWIKRRK